MSKPETLMTGPAYDPDLIMNPAVIVDADAVTEDPDLIEDAPDLASLVHVMTLYKKDNLRWIDEGLAS